jgi:flagellar hook-associated protein 2
MATSTVTTIGSANSNVSSTAASLAVTGLASGLNWSTIVSELAQAERSPEIQWQNQQNTIAAQNASYSTIKTDLTALQNDAKKLLDPSFFNSVVAASGSPAVASASATSGATLGQFSFNISQLATAAQMNGTTMVSQVLDPGGDPSTLTIGAAGFATPVTAGNFTVDGAQVAIATTDSLQTVFNNIASATGNKVTASYDATSDKITLTSSDGSPVVLGSATDTSNFLQVAQLYNNTTGTISSASPLGRVNTTASLSSSDLKTAITGDASGNGTFNINGVAINYNLSTDSIQDVLNNINNSAAGVSASYDVVNNRFVLMNKTTGDMGISLQDVSGNFLAATGLSGGTLQSGKNLLYTLNGGAQQLVSQSNTIDSSSSGVSGLSVTALTTGTTAVTVGTDTTTISNAIQQFVTDYTNTQNFINSQQSVTTAADGTVTAGPLTGDTNTNDIVTSLRSLVTAVVGGSGTSGAITHLGDLGFQTNGQDNTMTLSDSTALTSALQSHLNDVKNLFTNSTTGLAVQLNNYINNTIGDNGTLTSRQADLTQESSSIGTQITNLETKITNDSNQWSSEFQAMETAQAQTNQELTYLSQGVSNGSL